MLLVDPARAASDRLIIAVLLLATCEALHGLRESYSVQMIGLMNIVNSRGGLRELGFDGRVEAVSKFRISFLLLFMIASDMDWFSPLARCKHCEHRQRSELYPSCEESQLSAGGVGRQGTFRGWSGGKCGYFADHNEGKDVPMW